jgi:5-methylcytosine-specific restriction endonuclease McrA
MYSEEEWRALCGHFGNVCVRCGSDGVLQADHVQPLATGGSNDITNIQPLCAPCNAAKHTQTIDYRDPDQLACFLKGIRDDLPF